MFSGSRRAAIGSILLRSPGSSNPLQYSFKGACRSLCPAAVARPSIYAAKRLSCGPGAERRDPTKQFYINLFFYDPVVLGEHPVAQVLHRHPSSVPVKFESNAADSSECRLTSHPALVGKMAIWRR